MKKVALVGLTLLSLQVYAQDDLHQQLAKCANIDNDIARLECFDALVKAPNKQVNNDIKASAPNSNALTTNSVEKAPVVAAKPTIAENIEDDFGKEAKSKDVESITSTMIGTFKGWKKGMVVKLENGQKWRVTSARSGRTKLENPKVTIERAVFGTFNMTVEGFKTFAKVKRIK